MAKFWVQKDLGPKKLGPKNESKRIWSKKKGMKKLFGQKKKLYQKKCESKRFLGPTNVKIGLEYSIIFKLGQMFTGQMFRRKLATHTDGLIIEFG